MKTLIILSLILASSFCAKPVNAQTVQTSYNYAQLDTTQLKAQKEVIKAREKAELKKGVEKIEQKLQAGKITEAEARQMKSAAARKHAKNIEDQLNIIDAYIALKQRNGGKNESDAQYRSSAHFSMSDCDSIEMCDTTKMMDKPNRTHSHFTISFGLNNAIGPNQPLNDSPYKIGGSRFFGIGYEFSTALIKSGYLRLNYGISFQFNGLKPINNQYFVRKGEQVKLKQFPYNLKKAKLRQDNFVIPIYLEIGPTDESYHAEKFRLGFGGYVGLNLNTIQKLKYNKSGDHVKRKDSFSATTNNIIYGLSAYIGYDWVEFYLKYDLNTIFKNNLVDEHNVSVGLRFTLF